MNLSAWFQLQQKKQEKIITLEESLLNGRYKAYGHLRLKYFNLQFLLNYLSHLLFISALFHYFSHEHVMELNLLLALAAVFNGAWWGGLEALRAKVRYYHKQTQRRKLNETISNWIFFSLGCSFLTVLIMVFTLAQAEQASSLYLFSLSTIFLSFVISLPVKTYHSGIYALTRVGRTMPSMFIGDLTFLLVLILSYPLLHQYSASFAYLLKAIVGNIIAVYFISKAYELKQIKIETFNWYRFKSFLRAFPLKTYISASFCMASLSLDHLIVALGFIYTKATLGKDQITFLLYILPLLYASVDWAKLFYFDFKKDVQSDFKLFYQHFETNVMKIAFFSGVFFWLIACITALLFRLPGTEVLCFWLLPIMLLRSKIAILQIKHFAASHYGVVILSNALFYGTLIIIYWFSCTWILKAIFLLGVSLALFFFLSFFKNRNSKPTEFKAMHIYSWLEALRKELEEDTVEVHVFKLSPNIKQKAISGVIGILNNICKDVEYQAVLYKQQIVLFTKDITKLDCNELIMATGGWSYFHQRLVFTNIKEVKEQLVPLINTSTKITIQDYSLDNLKATFYAHFPHGICFDPKIKGNNSASLKRYIMQDILRGARNYLMDIHNKHNKPYSISVLYYAGAARLIFCIPKHQKHKKSVVSPYQWQEEMRVVNKFLILS